MAKRNELTFGAYVAQMNRKKESKRVRIAYKRATKAYGQQ